jgi:hypothetical protein
MDMSLSQAFLPGDKAVNVANVNELIVVAQ